MAWMAINGCEKQRCFYRCLFFYFLISTFNREGWLNLVFAVRIVGCMARRRTAVFSIVSFLCSIHFMKPMNYTHIFSENDFSEAVPRLIQTSDVTKKKVKPWLFQRVASGWRWICEDGQHGWFPLSHTKTEEAAWETWEQVWTSDWFNHCMIRAQQKLMWKIIFQESFLFHFPLAFLKQTNKASKKHLGSYLFPRVLSARKRVSPALVSCDVIQAEGDQLKGWRAEEEAKDCVGELSIQYMMSDTGSCLPSKIVILAYDIYIYMIYIYVLSIW